MVVSIDQSESCRTVLVGTTCTGKPIFGVSNEHATIERSTILAQHYVALKPSTAYTLNWEVEVIEDGSSSNTVQAFASDKASRPNMFFFEQSEKAGKGPKKTVEQKMFSPSSAKTDRPVMVDVGLRWSRDPFNDCSEDSCPMHKVRVLSFSVKEEEKTPVKTASTVGSVLSLASVGASVVVNSVAGSAMGSTSMGFVQQLQFSGMLAKLKGCPDEFKTFASGFDWTLLDWPLPWDDAFTFPWQDAVDKEAAFSAADVGKIVEVSADGKVRVDGEMISVNWGLRDCGTMNCGAMKGKIVSAEQKLKGVVVLADETCEAIPACLQVGNAKYNILIITYSL